jgi:hypothetical protein
VPIRATVQPMPEPGHAVLRLTELDASPDGLTLSLQRQQGPDSHLADDGWRRTEAWLLPALVERDAGALVFHLGPEICDHLAGVATVRLRVKEPDIGVVGTTVVAWPAMLTSGARGSSGAADDTIRLRRARPAPPPPVVTPPVAPAHTSVLNATRDPEDLEPPAAPPPPRRGLATWAMAALVLLVLGGAGFWGWTLREQDQTVASAPTAPTASGPQAKSIREVVAEYVATKPAPEAMFAKGREFAQSGEMAGAFLVWRAAAEAGNVASQIEVASFYDPVTPQTKGAFAPDGTRAADWYERAALAGRADAQRRLGLLFAKGGGGLDADKAKARLWLEQAAAQNDADAKKALAALPK